MPIQATYTAGSAEQVPQLAARAQRAAVAALDQWRSAADGIGIRFTARAFGLYGYTKRSPRYARKHPAPYVHQGRFRSGTLAGAGRIVVTQRGPDGWDATMTTPAARGLNFRRGRGIYADEWTRLQQPEATDIDRRVQQGLDRIA